MIVLFNRFTVPIIQLLTRTRFPNYVADIKHSAQQTGEQQLEGQFTKIKSLLQHATQHICQYKDYRHIADAPLSSEAFKRFPIATKGTLAAGFPDLVTDQTRAVTDWTYDSTSGTIDRLVTVKDFVRRDTGRATMYHAMNNALNYRFGQPIIEIPPNICNIVCGVTASNEGESFRRALRTYVQGGWKTPNGLRDLRGVYERRILYRSLYLNPLVKVNSTVEHNVLKDYLEKIGQVDNPIIHALPEYLLILARYVIATGIRPPRIKGVLPAGGATSPYMAEVIAKGLQTRFAELYGTAELGAIGYSESGSDALIANTAMFFLEIQRDERECAPGEVGHILVTDLCNTVMPFIRYQVGDVGYWLPTEENGSSNKSPRFKIVGRLQECIINEKRHIFTGNDIRDFFFGKLALEWFRVLEKKPGFLNIEYIPDSKYYKEKLIKDIQEFFGEEYKIRIKKVNSVPVEPNGKFRLIQSSSYERLPL